MSTGTQEQLDALSTFLHRQRRHLLKSWRDSLTRDPELTTSATLSRAALDDHLPGILNGLEERLRAEHALCAMQTDHPQRNLAAEHGLQRWQQGYDLRETMREWGHLQLTLLAQLERYANEHPDVTRQALTEAHCAVATLCMEGTCESASRYLRLKQAEAASRMRDLEDSLNALQRLENERAALLREAAHDLRGSVGVIANVSNVLAQPEVAGHQRDHLQRLLQQHIHSTSGLLGELMQLARLEAGQDPLELESFDAAAQLRAMCEALQPFAAERNLFLRHEGPHHLPVEGDPLKLQRILQNLLLNALKATAQGGVIVRWFVPSRESADQWCLRVQDTGPGLSTVAAMPLRKALQDATHEAHAAEVSDAPESGEPPHAGPPLLRSQSTVGSPPSGEGVGLTIVKRLCELLGASIELETAQGRGTTIQITFPLRYSPELAT
jgi:signal transduction histidine kinase